MFCVYDYSNFPIVKVTFNGIIHNENDFALFTDQWKALYKDKCKFKFIFDMEGMGLINPYWSYRVASFISELKKEPIQYLEQSTIINVKSYVSYLLKIVFTVQSPVAPVIIQLTDGSSFTINP